MDRDWRQVVNRRPKIFETAIIVSLLAAANCYAMTDGPYPVNMTNRPLILPKGTLEMTMGPAFLSGNEREDIQPVLDLRYAINDNLELTLLGLRYRIVNTTGQQWVTEIQNFGINTDLNHHTLVGLRGKQFLNPDWALQYRLAAYIADSHEKDGKTHEYRSSLGILYRLSRRGAVEAEYAYRDLSGFKQTSANFFKIKFHFAVLSDMDVDLGYADSNFNEAVDSVLFNESYRQRYDLVFHWRFH